MIFYTHTPTHTYSNIHTCIYSPHIIYNKILRHTCPQPRSNPGHDRYTSAKSRAARTGRDSGP